MNVVVYLKAEDERLLRSSNLDPAEWVRNIVREQTKLLADLTTLTAGEPGGTEITGAKEVPHEPVAGAPARTPPAPAASPAELPVEDAGTAPVSVPTATPEPDKPPKPTVPLFDSATGEVFGPDNRLTPEQSNLQAAAAETAASRVPAAKQFKPDFKDEPKPKKTRR